MLNLKQFSIDIRKFKKGKMIGKGGFSEVYLAKYKRSGEECTAKVLKSRYFKEEEKNNVENEIKSMSFRWGVLPAIIWKPIRMPVLIPVPNVFLWEGGVRI